MKSVADSRLTAAGMKKQKDSMIETSMGGKDPSSSCKTSAEEVKGYGN